MLSKKASNSEYLKPFLLDFLMAVPLGIEPRSQDLESCILTVEIWD